MAAYVGNAIGSANFIMVGLLIKWGYVGGLVTGLLGAGAATLLVQTDAISSFFIPKSEFPDNCNILGTYSDLQNLVKPFIIVISFTWPFQFMNNCAFGVLLGTGETQILFMASLVSSVSSVFLFKWWIDEDYISRPMTYAITVYLIPYALQTIVIAICYLRPQYYKQFQLHKSKMCSNSGRHTAVTAALDGIKLLTKDLLLTLQKSICLILAAHLGLGNQYQLVMYATIQSIYGNGGIYVVLCAYGMKLYGARLLGARMNIFYVFLY